MSDLDARLERALQAEAATAADPMFRVEVMMRRERRAFRKRLVAASGQALAAAVLTPFVLWAIDQLLGTGEARLLAMVLYAATLTAVFAGVHVRTPAAVRALSARLGSAFSGR